MSRTKYIFSLALKDAWKNKLSLMILCSCCLIGCMTLMSISSIKMDLNNSIDENTKSLLGADFLISQRQAENPEITSFFAELETKLEAGLTNAKEIGLASMVLFEKTNQTRLVQLSGISTNYPLYGEITTTGISTKNLTSGTALVDSNLKMQFQVNIGDKIKLGDFTLRVGGFIQQMPGSIAARSILAPRIIIHIDDIPKTGLIKKGSLVRYLNYYKLESQLPLFKIKEKINDQLIKLNLELETSEDRGEKIKKNSVIVYQFFDVVTLISFILGGIGIGTGSLIYFKQKRSFIQTLSYLGLKKIEAAYLFAIQICVFGTASILVGAFAGIFFQKIITIILKSFIPVTLTNTFSLYAFLFSIITSLFLLLIFTTFSAFLIFKKSELRKSTFRNYKISLLITLGLVALLVLWGRLVTNSFYLSLMYSSSIIIVVGLIYLFGIAFLRAAKYFSKFSGYFSIEQGIRNLYRPNNQIHSLFSAIGFSALTVFLILFVGEISTSKLSLIEDKKQANLLLFDIQADQVNDIKILLEKHRLPKLAEVPIVNMRIDSINGVAIAELKLQAEDKDSPSWTLSREYRSTYRNYLDDSEILLQGNLIPEFSKTDTNALVPVSLEKGITEKLGVKLLDKIVFNVQGRKINTYVSSIRQVDWQQIRPNFFIIFPVGVLEEAPKNFIFLSRYLSEKQNSKFQSELISSFGNVSAIDLNLIIKTLSNISDQLKGVITLLTTIILLTGIIILFGIVWGSRAVRIEENTILRTLGAKNKLIFQITAFEYLALALFGTTSGLILALLFGTIIAFYFFQTALVIPLLSTVILFFILNVLITLLGILGSWGTLNKSTLTSLRKIEY